MRGNKARIIDYLRALSAWTVTGVARRFAASPPHAKGLVGTCFLLAALAYLPRAFPVFAQTAPGSSKPAVRQTSTPHDGQHDFDFNFGNWKTHIRRLTDPLSASAPWIELNGTVVVRKVWGGRAQLEEVEADGPKGHFEDLGLFLYNPQAHQWSLSFANSRDGNLGQASIGEFKNGRGEFFDQESFHDRSILVRIIWSNITSNSHCFEQAFSDDGGKTWMTNMIATLTRDLSPTVPEPSQTSPITSDAEAQLSQRDAQRSFDFDIGTWKTHTSRLLHPLTGSSAWIEMKGITVVRKIWDGRANVAELESDGPTGHLELLSLRLYDPEAHQWNLNFATSNIGIRSVPMIGQFTNGCGEFFDQESFNGRTILVRFTMSPLTANTARSEQAFSTDGGKTWEVNWINQYTRVADGSDKRD